MTAYQYHSLSDLQQLGEKIQAKAIRITLSQEQSRVQAEASILQKTFPAGQAPPIEILENQAHIRDANSPDPFLESHLQSYLQGAYQDIPRLFTQFAVPDPEASSRPTLHALYKTAATLKPSLQIRGQGGDLATPLQVGEVPGTVPSNEITNIMLTHLRQWEGDAANAFVTYIHQLDTASDYQYDVAIDLAMGVEAMVAIRKSMLTDIWEIGQKTNKALDQLDRLCTNSASQVALLTIFGALAILFVTEGAPFLATFVQSAASIMSAGQTIASSGVPISGATVPPIITGMTQAISTLHSGIDQQEQVVARAMKAVSDSLDQHWQKAMLPAPPAVTGAANKSRAQLEQANGFYTQ